MNDSGTALERYSYSPYGEVTFLNADFSKKTTQTSAIGNNYLYTGRERDPETGLQLNRHRYYHAGLGRWLTWDPINYGGGMNLYGYVGGMPTYYVDPTGLKRKEGYYWPSMADLCRYYHIPGCGSGPAADTVLDDDIQNAQTGLLLTSGTLLCVAGGCLAVGVGGGFLGIGVGTTPWVAPGLGAGIYPAVMVGDRIYVARFHEIAWQAANRGETQRHGMVILDKCGKVIGWAYE